MKLASGRNSREFLDEITAFPNTAHDDCVDALAGAHKHLSKTRRGHATIHIARGNIDDAARRRPPRSAAEARAAIEREDRQLSQLASQLGIPYTHARRPW